MARLRAVKPRLAASGGKLTRPKDAPQTREQRRSKDQPWRRWYKTARWQRLRWKVLTGAGFKCRFCGRIEVDTSKLVADHIMPHRGDEVLFHDETNLQCLCKRCHDSTKQAQERRG